MSACGQRIECVTDGACTVLVACLVGIREASALPTWAPDTPPCSHIRPARFPRRPESSGSRLVRARVRTGTIMRASCGAESVNFFRRMARDRPTWSATHQEHERERERSASRWPASSGSVAHRHEKRATPPKRCSPSHVVRLVRARALLPSGTWPPERPCRKCLDFQASVHLTRLVRARSFVRARRPSPVGVMTRRKCHVFAQHTRLTARRI